MPGKRWVRWPTWYPIARVSYGIHLTHGYVLFAVLRALGIRDAITFGTWQFFAFFVAVMVATTLLVTVMFVCLESPLIELGRRWGLWLPQTAIGGSE